MVAITIPGVEKHAGLLINEIHRSFTFPSYDSSGNVAFETIVPGFYWVEPLENQDKTLMQIRGGLQRHPAAGRYNLNYLFDGSCPLTESERRAVDHSSELPVIQVLRRMTTQHLNDFFPRFSLSLIEHTAYGIVHNHWIAGKAHFLSYELGRRPSAKEVNDSMKADDERLLKEFRGYWGMMRGILNREIHLIIPSSTVSWPLECEKQP